MHLNVEIAAEITDHFADHLEQNPTDFVCVYGSSVYSPDKLTSDVDLFVVAHRKGSLALGPTIEFIKDLHIRHGRDLDAEVPYENKVLYHSKEVDDAVQFGGFEIIGNRIIVPKVQKTAAFLGGTAIKSRLFLNGLTTPHTVIGSEFGRYHHARQKAGEAVTLLAIGLQSEEEFDLDMLLGALTSTPSGRSGEMYLGYKIEYPIVKEHLYGVLSGAIERLQANNLIERNNEAYHVDWSTFDPLNYMKATK